jgi:glycosyltransferase involved in cell wall biosynthesis
LKRLISSYQLVKKSGFFDPVYYLLKNPEVRVEDIDPLRHFMRYGWKELRDPSPRFSVSFYLKSYPDVREKNMNPLVHYLLVGRAEGRQALPGKKVPREIHFSSRKKNKPRQSITLRLAFGYAKIYGLAGALRKAREKLIPKSDFGHPDRSHASNTIPQEPVRLPDIAQELLPAADVTVSVVIPTKNAGADMVPLLKVLNAQQGLKAIEIIVVDSGSQDETLIIAEQFGAQIIQIPPETFSHSHARNLGAQQARGDLLLFMVQDALPPNATWVWEMLQVLQQNEVSAVSCAESPREDADLFYRQICWNHYNFLGINQSDRIFSMPEKKDHISLRQNAQLSDLACLIPRELFLQYGYRRDYAEDLDLGLRLIQDGHRIAFLGSTRVIHSHNRSPYYFLKRGYVDNLFLSDMFSDFVLPRVTLEELIPDVIHTYQFLTDLIIRLDKTRFPTSTGAFAGMVSQTFANTRHGEYPASLPALQSAYLDPQAKDLLLDLMSRWGLGRAGRSYSSFFLSSFQGYVDITTSYLENSYEAVTKELLEEVKICLHKAFCILTGAYLAYCYRTGSAENSATMEQLHLLLKEGV